MASLAQTVLTLLAVGVLALGVVFAGRRFGWGAPSGPLVLVGRLPLDARRCVYLVRVGETVLVLGASEAGLTKLGELSAAMVSVGEARAARERDG